MSENSKPTVPTIKHVGRYARTCVKTSPKENNNVLEGVTTAGRKKACSGPRCAGPEGKTGRNGGSWERWKSQSAEGLRKKKGSLDVGGKKGTRTEKNEPETALGLDKKENTGASRVESSSYFTRKGKEAKDQRH